MVGRVRIGSMYRSLSPGDQHTFRWWAKANAICAATLVATLLTVTALASSTSNASQVAAKRFEPVQVSR